MKRPWIKLMCSLIACIMLLSATACRELSNETSAEDLDANLAAEQNKEVYSPLSNDVAATNAEQTSLVEDALAINNGNVLKFDENGQFKIVVFSDIQDGEYNSSYGYIKPDTLEYMNYFLDTEKPDLVLFSGDVICGRISTIKAFKNYLDAMSKPMEDRGIPWGQVNGNHEEGGYNYNCGIYKYEQIDVYMSYPHNVSKKGNVSGYGNYVLPILRNDDSGKIGFNVFCVDSHDYIYKYDGHTYGDGFEEAALPGKIYSGNKYDVIHFDQIKWYWDTSVALEEYNGSPIAALMMFHIPLYEMNYISQNQEESGFSGYMDDPISAPELNAGLFWAMHERGDVKLIVNGHDHMNDFKGTYMGITMAYCATIGSLEYYSEESRGIRVITINQDDPYKIQTEMIYCKDVTLP